ncbi:MAG TPA: hypothetical protein VF116_13145 [Ktedonobacterales bacterium]
MRQFERSPSSSAWTPGDKPEFPADFTADEMEFAGELRDLFAVEREELPPHFTQTLLENERHTAAERGFEERLTYRVFRRLRLRRDLALRPARRSPRPVARAWRAKAMRPLGSAIAAALALMILTMVLATPSFADGLRLIFGQTGVTQTARYPSHVQSYGSHGTMPHAAAFDPSMPLGWLGRSNGHYLYKGVRLQDPTPWSKGAIVELQYQLDGNVQGSGLLDIREFQINPHDAAVLQVVQAPYATPATINGNVPAVYVDGIWMPRAAHRVMDMMSGDTLDTPYVWESGTRSELIFEVGNVIYWMVGDQRDGMDQNELVRLAGQIVPVQPASLQLSRVALSMAGNSLADTFGFPASGHELYQVIPVSAAPNAGAGWFVASTS